LVEECESFSEKGGGGGEKHFSVSKILRELFCPVKQIEVTRICNLAGMENGREREKIGIK